MVYRHGGTLLLNTARANGAEVVDGLEILVAQGAASLERWTGRTAPDQAMREAVADIASMSSTFDTATKPRRGNGITTPSRRGGSGRVLTDVIVDLGFVDRGTMDLAIDRATESGGAPERVLVADGTLTDDQLARAVAERFGLDHVDLKLYRVDPDAAKLVAPAAVRRYQAVPVSFVGDRTLLVAMVDPANVLAIDDIAVMTGYEVRPAVASLADVELAARAPRGPELRRRRDRPEELEDDPEADQAPAHAERARRAAVRHARERADQLRRRRRGRVGHPARAPGDQGGRRARRLRHPLRAPGRRDAGPLPHRRRAPGGRDRARSAPSRPSSRASRSSPTSTSPSAASRRTAASRSRSTTSRSTSASPRSRPRYGEKVVMRILDQSKVMIQLEQLGMLPQALERFTKAFGQAHGAVLVTGPTGSGKSTSLYGALNQLNTIEKHIITIEDPVEYQLQGITQVQVNNKAGLTFASGLRSMMRADPDIIMVGEIRDRETAQIAIEAALTGHLVLSARCTPTTPRARSRA